MYSNTYVHIDTTILVCTYVRAYMHTYMHTCATYDRVYMHMCSEHFSVNRNTHTYVCMQVSCVRKKRSPGCTRACQKRADSAYRVGCE